MENYRKIYETECNIKLPKGFVIHHIDFDRNNNSIDNLVALPEELHREYHIAVSQVRLIDIEILLSSTFKGGNGLNYYSFEVFLRFKTVWEECNKWLDYRDFLLNRIPNIHSLKME